MKKIKCCEYGPRHTSHSKRQHLQRCFIQRIVVSQSVLNSNSVHNQPIRYCDRVHLHWGSLKPNRPQQQQRGALYLPEIELKSCFRRIFNSKLDRITVLISKCLASMQPLLELKTQPRIHPVWISKKSRLLKFCQVSAMSAANSKGIFVAATNSANQTNKAGSRCHQSVYISQMSMVFILKFLF